MERDSEVKEWSPAYVPSSQELAEIDKALNSISESTTALEEAVQRAKEETRAWQARTAKGRKPA